MILQIIFIYSFVKKKVSF